MSELLAASKKRTDSLVSQGDACALRSLVEQVPTGLQQNDPCQALPGFHLRVRPCLQKSASARSDTSLLESKRRALERKLEAKQRGVSSAHFIPSLRLLLVFSVVKIPLVAAPSMCCTAIQLQPCWLADEAQALLAHCLGTSSQLCDPAGMCNTFVCWPFRAIWCNNFNRFCAKHLLKQT